MTWMDVWPFNLTKSSVINNSLHVHKSYQEIFNKKRMGDLLLSQYIIKLSDTSSKKVQTGQVLLHPPGEPVFSERHGWTTPLEVTPGSRRDDHKLRTYRYVGLRVEVPEMVEVQNGLSLYGRGGKCLGRDGVRKISVPPVVNGTPTMNE